jgi:hypothetical protein
LPFFAINVFARRTPTPQLKDYGIDEQESHLLVFGILGCGSLD